MVDDVEGAPLGALSMDDSVSQLPERSLTWMERGLAGEGGGGSPGGGPLLNILRPPLLILLARTRSVRDVS
jgi:hypothetical protein